MKCKRSPQVTTGFTLALPPPVVISAHHDLQAHAPAMTGIAMDC